MKTVFKKILNCLYISVLCIFLAFSVTGCSGEKIEESKEDNINIVVTISILADIVENIAGDRAEVDYLVPIGDHPEEYEPIPSDFRKLNDADIFYYNGVGLEDWIQQIVNSATDTKMIKISEGCDLIHLEGDEEGLDPHVWLDPKNINNYIENILNSLNIIDPEGKEYYKSNAEKYSAKLKDLDSWIKNKVNKIPKDNRIIVVSENAFKYYGDRYGFETEGIWELNAHEEGTPQQIARIIDLVIDKKVPALFVESSVDTRYMKMVSENTEVEIKGLVYTDSLGEKGSGAETYINMMKKNTQTFLEALR